MDHEMELTTYVECPISVNATVAIEAPPKVGWLRGFCVKSIFTKGMEPPIASTLVVSSTHNRNLIVIRFPSSFPTNLVSQCNN